MSSHASLRAWLAAVSSVSSPMLWAQHTGRTWGHLQNWSVRWWIGWTSQCKEAPSGPWEMLPRRLLKCKGDRCWIPDLWIQTPCSSPSSLLCLSSVFCEPPSLLCLSFIPLRASCFSSLAITTLLTGWRGEDLCGVGVGGGPGAQRDLQMFSHFMRWAWAERLYGPGRKAHGGRAWDLVEDPTGKVGLRACVEWPLKSLGGC